MLDMNYFIHFLLKNFYSNSNIFFHLWPTQPVYLSESIPKIKLSNSSNLFSYEYFWIGFHRWTTFLPCWTDYWASLLFLFSSLRVCSASLCPLQVACLRGRQLALEDQKLPLWTNPPIVRRMEPWLKFVMGIDKKEILIKEKFNQEERICLKHVAVYIFFRYSMFA